MGFCSMLIFLVFVVNLLFFLFSQSATVVVDGVSQWKNPQAQIGDSVVFQHKYNYSLYIFKNQNAFSTCNFSQATILTKPSDSSYTWHVSRSGLFFFAFNNGSNQPCLDGQKLAVKVSATPPKSHAASPQLSPPMPSVATPPPSTGGMVASSPAYPWPFQPHESDAPALAPGLAPMAPDREGIPFINSNPAVPLPTGEVDSATIRPLPTSGHPQAKQVVGFWAMQTALSSVFFLMLMMMI